jgi:predicted kinase
LNNTIVLTSGLPGSGKTTLAGEFGTDLGLPILERDRFQNLMLDQVPVESVAASKQIGAASWELLFDMVPRLAATGAAFAVDSNFSRRRHRERLSGIARDAGYGIVEVHCTAPPGVLLERYRTRAVDQRHPAALDRERVAEFAALFEDPAMHEDAVVFPGDALVVDTSKQVALVEIEAWIRARSG